MLSQASGWTEATLKFFVSAAVSRKKSTFEWRLRRKFLSLNFAPPGPKMNEALLQQTSSESSWNFETKFLPVQGNLGVFDRSFIMPGLQGSAWEGDPEAKQGQI